MLTSHRRVANGLVALLFGASAACMMITMSGASTFGRSLLESEMASAIGDNNKPCAKDGTCDTPIASGSGGAFCSYCDETTARKYCCNQGPTGSVCMYKAGEACPNDSNFWSGNTQGSPGTCLSCNSGNFTDSGDSCSLVPIDPASDNCP